jgi:hypothetical protein
MKHDINFINENNHWQFDSIDFKDNLIAFYYLNHRDEEQYVVFKWNGVMQIFKDYDDLYGEFVNHKFIGKITIVPELSDDNLTLLGYDEDNVIEHLAQQFYNFEE